MTVLLRCQHIRWQRPCSCCSLLSLSFALLLKLCGYSAALLAGVAGAAAVSAGTFPYFLGIDNLCNNTKLVGGRTSGARCWKARGRPRASKAPPLLLLLLLQLLLLLLARKHTKTRTQTHTNTHTHTHTRTHTHTHTRTRPSPIHPHPPAHPRIHPPHTQASQICFTSYS